jgi:DNA gyrase/topoisomerase IV subunit A
VILPSEVPIREPIQEKIELLLHNPLGQVLRLEMNPEELSSGEVVYKMEGEIMPGGMPPGLLTTYSQEELLFIFDSGRTVRRPVTQVPLMGEKPPGWQTAFLEEPRVKEELASLQTIGKMPLFELCIQASRRGYLKKMKTSFFTSHLEENYIGSGVNVRADKTCGVTFANQNDFFVMVSQEGFIFSMQADRLPTAIEEVIQLGITDHIVSTFIVGQKPSLLFITQNGKAVHRETTWLEPANSFKSKGQAILSKERREAGIRIVGAAPVEEANWGIVLQSDGSLTPFKLADLIARGSLEADQVTNPVLALSVFVMPE